MVCSQIIHPISMLRHNTICRRYCMYGKKYFERSWAAKNQFIEHKMVEPVGGIIISTVKTLVDRYIFLFYCKDGNRISVKFVLLRQQVYASCCPTLRPIHVCFFETSRTIRLFGQYSTYREYPYRPPQSSKTFDKTITVSDYIARWKRVEL